MPKKQPMSQLSEYAWIYNSNIQYLAFLDIIIQMSGFKVGIKWLNKIIVLIRKYLSVIIVLIKLCLPVYCVGGLITRARN